MEIFPTVRPIVSVAATILKLTLSELIRITSFEHVALSLLVIFFKLLFQTRSGYFFQKGLFYYNFRRGYFIIISPKYQIPFYRWFLASRLEFRKLEYKMFIFGVTMDLYFVNIDILSYHIAYLRFSPILSAFRISINFSWKPDFVFISSLRFFAIYFISYASLEAESSSLGADTQPITKPNKNNTTTATTIPTIRPVVNVAAAILKLTLSEFDSLSKDCFEGLCRFSVQCQWLFPKQGIGNRGNEEWNNTEY